MNDYRKQQEQDELQSFLWHSLNNLKPYISAELFKQIEHQIGLIDN